MATDLASAQENHVYSQALTVVGAQGPLAPGSWEVDAYGGTLPPGLLLNTTTGAITGTPTASSTGTYPFTIILEDAVGTTCSKDYSIRVRPDPFKNIVWTTGTVLNNGVICEAEGAGDAARVYSLAKPLAGSQPIAFAYGVLTATALPLAISCNANFVISNIAYYVNQNTWLAVLKNFLSVYSVIAPVVGPELGLGLIHGPYNYAFTIPAGNSGWEFQIQSGVTGGPPAFNSSTQIHLLLEVL